MDLQEPGQIVCMTYPLIGNYGVNESDVESRRPWVEGFVVREASRVRSNWRSTFGHEAASRDQVGFLDGGPARFGKTYADEPDRLVKALAEDEAVAAADTLLLTVPNQLGVDYNAHVLESVVKLVAPELGWR
jgi:hypothetical protein